MFVSKSTFSMDLLDRLAARTLKIARNNVTRTSFDRRPMFKRWLRDFGDEISSVSFRVEGYLGDVPLC